MERVNLRDIFEWDRKRILHSKLMKWEVLPKEGEHVCPIVVAQLAKCAPMVILIGLFNDRERIHLTGMVLLQERFQSKSQSNVIIRISLT